MCNLIHTRTQWNQFHMGSMARVNKVYASVLVTKIIALSIIIIIIIKVLCNVADVYKRQVFLEYKGSHSLIPNPHF